MTFTNTNQQKLKKMIVESQNAMRDYGIKPDVCNQIILKLMAIQALSLRGELPDDLTFSQETAEYKGEWLKLLQALRSSKNLQVKSVFADEALEELPVPLMHNLVNKVLANLSTIYASLAVDTMSVLIETVSMPNHQNHYADISVYQLISAILNIEDSETIYVTSPASLPACLVISQDSDNVYYETINQSGMMAQALSLLSPHQFQIEYADNLANPSHVVGKNQLRQFDYGVSLSPMGTRLPSVVMDKDSYRRFFTINPRKIEIAQIQHLLKQCSQKIVVSVTEGVLYSTMEQEFREYLIKNGLLQAVISLPNEIWTNTSVKTSLLVIDPEGGHQTVRLVDVTDDEFIKKTTRRLVGLKNLDDILHHLTVDEETDNAVTVSQNDLKNNAYFINVGRYLLSPKEKKLERLTETSETVLLNDLVRFERGLPLRPEEGDFTILEVGANELNSIGDIMPPTKENKISEAEWHKHQSGFLQPNDIVFILKGSAGKVGLVPEDVPTSGEVRWMVNRSGIVLRTLTKDVDAKTLFAYLSSEVGQLKISQLIKGTSIPNISLKELKKIPVIVPTPKTQQQAIDFVDYSRKIQATIKRLLEEQKALKSQLWSI